MVYYGITLKVSKSEYKVWFNFMDSTLVSQVLYINVLNCRYFHTNCSLFNFLKNKKKRLKNKKKH